MAKVDALTEPEFGQQLEKEALTQPRLSQQQEKMTLTELELSQIKPEANKNKGGRPRKAPDVTPWTVRGVDLETRTAIEKIATRNGKTIGQYMNEDLRQYAQEQLKKGNQAPIKQEDIRSELDDIKGMITQLASRMPIQEKRGFFQCLFG
jgi:predicted hydrocarbon binding protein